MTLLRNKMLEITVREQRKRFLLILTMEYYAALKSHTFDICLCGGTLRHFKAKLTEHKAVRTSCFVRVCALGGSKWEATDDSHFLAYSFKVLVKF